MPSKVSDEKDTMHQPCFLMLFSVHFYSWFNYFRFSLLLLLFFCVYGYMSYDNEFDTKENKISTKHRSEPQQ